MSSVPNRQLAHDCMVIKYYKAVRWFILSCMLGLFIYASVAHYREETFYTCLECRAKLMERTFFKVPFNRIVRHPYTFAYLEAHPEHEHQWCWSGERISRSIFSETRARGDRHAIWALPIEMQARFAMIVTEARLKEVLTLINSPDQEKAQQAVIDVFDAVLDAEGK